MRTLPSVRQLRAFVAVYHTGRVSAAAEQLELWAERAGIEIVRGQAGSDPGAVVFDAIEAAKARGHDVLIIDTAGRLHTQQHLMDELRKVRKVIERQAPGAPHETLLTIAWSREEPSDDNAVETVHQLTRALDDHLRNEPDTRVDVLIDLVVVRRNFPKAISAFSSWMLGKRHHVRAGAFATKSLLLRAALSAASMMPGLTAKGFGDAESARKFLREFKG